MAYVYMAHTVAVTYYYFLILETYSSISGSPCLHNFNACVQKCGILGTRLCGASKWG